MHPLMCALAFTLVGLTGCVTTAVHGIGKKGVRLLPTDKDVQEVIVRQDGGIAVAAVGGYVRRLRRTPIDAKTREKGEGTVSLSHKAFADLVLQSPPEPFDGQKDVRDIKLTFGPGAGLPREWAFQNRPASQQVERSTYTIGQVFPYRIEGKDYKVRIKSVSSLRADPLETGRAGWAYPTQVLLVPAAIIDALSFLVYLVSFAFV